MSLPWDRKERPLLNIKEEDKILEIGCGAGSLSFYLIQTKATIDLIDIDERMISKLNKDFYDFSNARIYCANAIDYDISRYNKIISNMPYYVTNSLLEKILLEGVGLEKSVLMIQKEC